MKKFYITRSVAVKNILMIIEMLYDDSDKMDFIKKFMSIMRKSNNNGVFIEDILEDKIIKLLGARCFCKKILTQNYYKISYHLANISIII